MRRLDDRLKPVASWIGPSTLRSVRPMSFGVLRISASSGSRAQWAFSAGSPGAAES
jgi:hypothetical protein